MERAWLGGSTRTSLSDELPIHQEGLDVLDVDDLQDEVHQRDSFLGVGVPSLRQ
jgi:hypothetical protein